jgi:hypothetical protein
VSGAVTWSLGGDARVLTVQGDVLSLRSSRSFPPGAPAAGTLEGEVPIALTLKVAGSRREDDGRYVVRGRLVSPTVALRAALAALPLG